MHILDTLFAASVPPRTAAPTSAQAASDSALMSAVAGNDAAAFAELVTRWERGVRAYCASLLGDPALARQAALATFATVWETRATYRPTRDVVLHLLGVARHHSQRLALRRHLRWRLRSVAQPLAPVAGSEAQARLLRLAAQRLPESLRTPLLLRFGQQLDYERMALLLRISPNAARARAFSGLKALADYLPAEANPWSV